MLPLVHDVSTKTFREGLEEVNAWTVGTFQGDATLWQQCVASAKHAVVIGEMTVEVSWVPSGPHPGPEFIPFSVTCFV